MEKYKKYFLNIEVLFLLIISLNAIFSKTDSVNLFQRFIIILLVSISTEYIASKIYRTSSFNFQNLSFALVIFFITNIQTNLFLPIFAVIFSQLSFYLIKYSGEQIFNHVTLSVFIFSLFGMKITWWGANSGFFIIILIVAFGLVLNYFKSSIISSLLFFLSLTAFSLFLTINPLYSIKQIFIPGVIYFGFFLLSNNLPYSDNLFSKSAIYVISIAFLSIVIPKFGIFTDPLITSIFLTDTVFFSYKFIKPS